MTEKPKLSEGGLVRGPGPIACTVEYLRAIDDGLHVVSINGGRPEYLVSQSWLHDHPNRIPPLGDPPEASNWAKGVDDREEDDE